GFHAAARAGAQVGQTAVILGGGCIGLCTLMALHARGVGGVYLFDLIDKRLKIAEELGAAGAYNAKHVDPVEKIYELTGGKGADVVFETAGAVQTTKQTAHLVRRGGVVVIVGQGGNASVEYDFGTVTAKEIDLRTIFRYRNLYPTVMEAVAGGKLPLKKIVSDVFRFDEVDKALEYCVTHKEDIVKAVIAF
ncbi:MAG: zinc-binding dehydrogenase, partial [Clostridiales bacterium]|nr:zinc-binding dehydrogenase [Clostridiales bacterium]